MKKTNLKKSLAYLCIAAGLALLLVLAVGILQWIPYLEAHWTVNRNVDSDDKLNSLMAIVADPSFSYDARILAYQDVHKMICYTQNFENLIGLTSSMVSITTNTNYYPIITDRAEARGEDPEALIQKLQDHSYYARGLVYAETEQSVKAIQDFMKVSDEGRSTFDRYYEALGLAAFKANVWELARLGLKGYLAEHDADWSWLHMLGVSHLNLGAYKAAESNFLQAISLNTNAVDSYAYLSGLYSTCEVKEMRDGSRALELIDTAFEISEKPTAFLYDMKACALAELGEFEESIRYAQQAMEIAQQDSTLAGYSTGLAQRMSAFKSGNAWTEHLQQLQKIEQEPGEGREISSRPSG